MKTMIALCAAIGMGAAGFAHAQVSSPLIEAVKDKSQICMGWPLRIGASPTEAINAWCFPERVNITETALGIREQWVYPGIGYLYFDENGKLVRKELR